MADKLSQNFIELPDTVLELRIWTDSDHKWKRLLSIPGVIGVRAISYENGICGVSIDPRYDLEQLKSEILEVLNGDDGDE